MNLPTFSNAACLLKATYHINTPMFAAGSNTQEAELTPTSFKGVMRFWWRALNWSQIRLDNSNDTEALKALHKQEAKLFGVAANNEREFQGQGGCLLNSLTFTSSTTWRYEGRNNGLNYLMGQGLFHFRDGLSREAINPQQKFEIELTVEPQFQPSIIDVLKLIGLLGGFGSRSRHGLGAVTLMDIAVKTVQEETYQALDIDISDAASAIHELLTKYSCKENEKLPPISAFYAGTRIDVINNYKKDAIDLLGELGEEQQMYRSYGRNNEVNRKKAEKNFKDDHDLILNIADRSYKGRPSHPRRAVFGLPHNYFFSSNHLKADVDSTTGRRSSPLFIHIHKTDNGEYQALICLMKSQFLPNDEKITFSANRQRIDMDVNVDWQVITDFMDRAAFANKETL